MVSGSVVKASVILPTKDRGEAILPTLESLQALVVEEPWELVIVDNCSGAASRALLQRWAIAHPQRVRYVAEPKLGLNNARNCGIRHSTGEIVAFLDDDATVPPHWLQNIVNHFAVRPRAYALGGKVIARFASPPPPWLDERLGLYISNFDRGEAVEKLRYNDYPRGANMAFRREAFAQCGYFRDCFDRKGRSLMSYGDIEMCYRLDRAGLEVLYVPDAEVYHHIRGDRLTEQWFERRFYWQGRSEGLFELLHFGRPYVRSRWRERWQKCFEGDRYDRFFYRGWMAAIVRNYFRRRFD